MQQSSHQFKEILDAAKEKRGDSPIDTMIVSSHLAQMRMFILRRGIEFFADQDSYGARREFLKEIYDSNMLEMKLESIIDYFLCDGQGLFYFRPSGETYQLLYFPKDSYRAYRDQNGELINVELVYSFAVKEPSLSDVYSAPNKRGGKKKYIRLKVFKDKIVQTISNEKIEFENAEAPTMLNHGGQEEELTNSLGFIPAVEVFNHLDCTGEATGTGEFDWLENQILFHDELVKNVRKNMKFFGNPTLVSSRPKHDILESGDEGGFKPTISSQAGFYDPASRPSTRTSQPFGTAGIDGQIKVPRVIANLEPTDRVSYMTPDAVSGDQNMYIKQYRSEIRLALGGVDDIDIGTASTAYEMKSLYGRVSATAEKKAKALFDHGLCKLLSMMIQHEEFLFQESFAAAVGLVKPVIPLIEQFEDPAQYEEAMVKYQKDYIKFLDERAALFDAMIQQGTIPQGVTGLIPDGSAKVSWRWTGDIFEEDSQGILNNSIVVRNLQELGVDSIEALKYLFPSKTDEERSAMLTGFPFRVVQQSQAAFNSFIQMLGQLYQLPHPQMPNQPLAADPNLDITGFLYRSLEFLRKELSYSGKYKPDDSDTRASVLSDADRKRAQLGLPTRDERPVALPGATDGSRPGNAPGGTVGPSGPGLPAGGGPAGFGGEPMAGRVPGAERKPEYAASVPGPGTVLGVSDTNPASQYTGELGFATGDADLRSPSFNPRLFGPGGQGATGSAAKPDSKPSTKRKRKS